MTALRCCCSTRVGKVWGRCWLVPEPGRDTCALHRRERPAGLMAVDVRYVPVWKDWERAQ